MAEREVTVRMKVVPDSKSSRDVEQLQRRLTQGTQHQSAAERALSREVERTNALRRVDSSPAMQRANRELDVAIQKQRELNRLQQQGGAGGAAGGSGGIGGGLGGLGRVAGGFLAVGAINQLFRNFGEMSRIASAELPGAEKLAQIAGKIPLIGGIFEGITRFLVGFDTGLRTMQNLEIYRQLQAGTAVAEAKFSGSVQAARDEFEHRMRMRSIPSAALERARQLREAGFLGMERGDEIGRASCRERV